VTGSFALPHRFRIPARTLAAVLLGWGALAAAWSAEPLRLDEVLRSVKERYPPLLAALIEQDVANGRAQQALGAFDTGLALGARLRPAGYYDGTTGQVVLQQPLSSWGGEVYGGYRFSGGFLADYDKARTQDGGEALLGFRLPLLRDGGIDKRRADLYKARIDQELADPFILRQHIDFIRAATVSYYQWVAAGFRFHLAEQLLEIARGRQEAIVAMVERGAQAPIVQVDNERLVVSRELGVVSARRQVEAAAIELSLFYRDAADQPVRPGLDRLPPSFPETGGPSDDAFSGDLRRALTQRPEVRRLELTMQKNAVDQKLARNNLLPNLDVAAEVLQAGQDRVRSDIEQQEVEARVGFSVPLQRREAKGRLAAAEANLEQLKAELQFARDQITAAVQDAWSALEQARAQIRQTARNTSLAQELEKAESERFRQGAADLLALQIREQATFDARILEVQATADFFRALAFYRAAIAADAPAFRAVSESAPAAP
jgi:outer membrane protein TolC